VVVELPNILQIWDARKMLALWMEFLQRMSLVRRTSKTTSGALSTQLRLLD
jgi:hypothetical protein